MLPFTPASPGRTGAPRRTGQSQLTGGDRHRPPGDDLVVDEEDRLAGDRLGDLRRNDERVMEVFDAEGTVDVGSAVVVGLERLSPSISRPAEARFAASERTVTGRRALGIDTTTSGRTAQSHSPSTCRHHFPICPGTSASGASAARNSRGTCPWPRSLRRAMTRPSSASSSAGIRPLRETPMFAIPDGHVLRASIGGPIRWSVPAASWRLASVISVDHHTPAQLSQRPHGRGSGSSSWRMRNSIRQAPVDS